MTYLSDFILSVKEWIDDTDPSDNLVTQWVRLAETRMNNELRTDLQIVRQEATFDDNCAVLPDHWLELLYVRLIGGRPLVFISNQAYWDLTQEAPPLTVVGTGEVWPWPIQQKGVYTLIGRNLFLWPSISANDLLKFEICYYRAITPLSDVADDVYRRYPDIYLNCTLAAAAPYLVEDERLNTFAALSTAQIKTANDSSHKARFSGSPMTPVIRRFG
jgi:hypothetical protein